MAEHQSHESAPAGAYELAIIGAGNMAEAIVRGALSAGLFQPGQLIAADPSAPRRALFEAKLGVRAVDRPELAGRGARRILLSVKPQQMQEVLGAIGSSASAGSLVISIAAGVGCAFIERGLGQGARWRVVRAMPNTPMLVGKGMTAISAGASATADDLADARRIFQAAGSVIEVPESQLDAVTAMSGSGPAYFFFLVEQMIRAGVELGLDPAQSRQLAAQTALGAAEMLTATGDSPELLRQKVTSPNGTTHAAITRLEADGFPSAVVAAIHAAARRSRELGK